MANTTIEELLNLAYEVRDADQAGENTALRVGGLLEEIIQYLSTVVGLDTLQAILAEYATVSGNGVIHWRQSSIVCLASMGYDLDNIDGGNWNYTNSNGDIVFRPSGGGCLNVVGTSGDFSVLQNVVYVNNHTGHAYLWKLVGNTYKMVEIRDSSPTTIITYLNTPPFSQVAVGESYFYTSGSTRKIAIKLSSDEVYSFDPDPKKIYVFLDTKQVMVWDSGNRQWISVGGNLIQLVNDLTTGGGDKALSADMGKRLRDQMETIYQRVQTLYGLLGNIAFWNGKPAASALLPDLDWGAPKHAVNITNSLSNSVITRNGQDAGSSFQAEEGSTVTLIVAPASGFALTSVSYVKDGGSSTSATSLGDGTYKIEFVMGSSNVAITVSGTAVAAYSVMLNLTHCNMMSGPTSVVSGGEATFVFAAAQGYALPSANPTVSGATITSWDKATGTLVIGSVTGNVEISIAAVEALPYEVPTGGELLHWWDGNTIQSGDTAWVDRIRQISVPKASNTDTGTTPDPTNHCWVFNSSYNTTPHGLVIRNSSLDDIDADDCTIEVVYKAKFDGSFTRANVCVFHRRDLSGTYGVPGGIYFCSKNGTSATDAFICGCNAGDVNDGTWDNSNVNDEICCIGMNNDDAVKNGSALALKTGTNATGYVISAGNEAGKGAICIGCYSNSANIYSVFKGNIYAIRIYRGHLTAAQMLANQKVDNERYNLGLTLPDSVQ